MEKRRKRKRIEEEQQRLLETGAVVPSSNSASGKKGKKKPKNPKPVPPPVYTQVHPSSNILADGDARDLSALLSYGPAFLPYTAAWTDNRIEQSRAFKRWVYVAIDMIAQTFCTKHPNVSYLTTGDPDDYRVKFDPQRDSLRRSYSKAFPHLPENYINHLKPATKLRHLERYKERQKALTPLLSHESLSPVPNNHPLRQLLSDPNEPDTAYTLWYETIMFYLLTGNAYWWMPRNRAGKPMAIWCVPSHWMWPVVGQSRLIDGWEIRPVEGNYLNQVLPADEIIHFRHPNPISKIDGFSPLTGIAQWADVSESIDRSRTQAFRQGMTPTVAVQFDGTLNDPDESTLRRIEAKFIARYYGENRSNRPIFLPPGVRVVPLTIRPNQMVWGENSKETRDNILGAYHVPPGIVAVEPTQPGDQITFCSQALNPLASMFGERLSETLAICYDKSRSLKIWWEDFVPDNPQHLDQTIKTDLLAGAITPNEIRIMRGRQPIPEAWADQPIIPVNMRPMSLPQGGQHLAPDDMPITPEMPEQPDLDGKP